MMVTMADGRSGPVQRPSGGRGRWTSFVAATAGGGGKSRGLREEGNDRHRVRVEHDKHTLLVHVSDEDGGGWTTIAIDRATRAWSVAQRDRQLDAASSAYNALYE
jgi:hypothetical protein